MELYFEGIHPPELGSPKDFIFRKYQQKRKLREIRGIALQVKAQGWVDPQEIQTLLRDHIDDVLFFEDTRAQEEKSLFQEYEGIRSHRPKLSRRRDGSLVVEGFDE